MMNSCPNKNSKEYKILQSKGLSEEDIIKLFYANGQVLPFPHKDLKIGKGQYSISEVNTRQANLQYYNQRFNSKHRLEKVQVGNSDLYTISLIEDWNILSRKDYSTKEFRFNNVPRYSPQFYNYDFALLEQESKQDTFDSHSNPLEKRENLSQEKNTKNLSGKTIEEYVALLPEYFPKRETTTKEILGKLQTSRTFNGVLAKAILKFIHNDAKILLLSLEEAKEFRDKHNVVGNITVEQSGGFFHSGTNAIVIIDRPQNPIGLRSIILHEIIHAQTWQFLRTNEEAANRFKDLYNIILNTLSPEEAEMYPFSNFDEFAAHLPSSKFLSLLASKTPVRSSNKTLYDYVVDFFQYIFKKIGIDIKGTLAEDYINETLRLIEEAHIYYKAEEEEYSNYPSDVNLTFDALSIKNEENYTKGRENYQISPKISSADTREIIQTFVGIVFRNLRNQEEAVRNKVQSKVEIFNNKGILNPILEIELKYRAAKNKANKTPEEQYHIDQWEEIRKKENLQKLQTWILDEVKQYGYKVQGGEIQQSEDEVKLYHDSTEDINQSSLLDQISDDDYEIGKGSQGNDYAGMSRSDKQRLSPKVKAWLATIPSTVPSVLGFDTNQFLSLKKVDATLSKALERIINGEEMIVRLSELSKAYPNLEWLENFSKQLEQEKNANTEAYYGFVSKYIQKVNNLFLQRVIKKPDFYTLVSNGKTYKKARRTSSGEILYNTEVKIINLNRNKIADNLREVWEEQFIGFNYTLDQDNNVYFLPNETRIQILQEYTYFENLAKSGKFKDDPEYLREQLKHLLSLINVELLEDTLDSIVDNFNILGGKKSQNFNPYDPKTNRNSVFAPKTGYLDSIFSMFKEEVLVDNPFSTSGMIAISEVEKEFTELYADSSVNDGKGRKLWAFGLPDPNERELARILTDPIDGLSESEFEKSYVGRLLKDKFSSRSVILNKLKSLRMNNLEYKKFVESLVLYTFNTLKINDEKEGKELKDMNEKEHIITKMFQFASQMNDVSGSSFSRYFITTPSDKSKMECIQSIKHNLDIKLLEDGTYKVGADAISKLYNYFLAEYDRIYEFQNLPPEVQEQQLSNVNYFPEAFYLFPDFDYNSAIWKIENGKLKIRGLEEIVHTGETVENYIKRHLHSIALQEIDNFTKFIVKHGVYKDGKIGFGVPATYINSLPEAISNRRAIRELDKEDAVESFDLQTNLIEAAQVKATKYLIADFALNDFMHNMEMHTLLLGDPAMYVKDNKARQGAIDNMARISELLESADNFEPIRKKYFSFIRGVFTNLGKRMAGVQGSRQEADYQIDENTRVLKIADNVSGRDFTSKQYAAYVDAFGEEFASKFKGIKSGDGQGIISPQEDLKLKLKYAKLPIWLYNSILRKVEMAEDDIENGLPIREEAKFTDKEKFFTQPIKPLIFANKLQEYEYNDEIYYKRKVDYFKNSEYALYPQFTEGFEIDKLRQLLKNTKADRIEFLTAVKAGADKVIEGVFNEDGTINYPTQVTELAIEEVPREYFGIQMEVPYDESKNKIRISTQQVVLIFNEILEKEFTFGKSKFKGKDLKTLQAAIYRELFNRSAVDIFNSLGIEVQVDPEDPKNPENWTFLYNDLDKLQTILIKEAESRGYGKSVIDGLSLNEDKKSFKIPLLFSGNLDKMEKLLLSFIKDIIFQKIHGRSLVLASELGWLPSKTIKEGEDGQSLIEYHKNNIVFTEAFDWDNGLQPVRPNPENPEEWLPAQVIIPWKFKDGNKNIRIENFITEKDGRKFLDLSKFDKSLLDIIGIRIPTQGFPSMASIEIVGFLPQQAGDIIIAPQDFTVIFGSDFDVDKLYTYIYNYSFSDDETKSRIRELIDRNRELWKIEKSVEYDEIKSYLDAYKEEYKNRFESAEFEDFIYDVLSKELSDSELQDTREFFEDLSVEDLNLINLSTHTKKSAKRKNAPSSIEESFPNDLEEANNVKNAIKSYNKYIKSRLENKYTKLSEYTDQLDSIIDGEIRQAIEERKEGTQELKQLLDSQRIAKNASWNEISSASWKLEDTVEMVEDLSIAELQNTLIDIYHTILKDPEVIAKSLEGISEGKLLELSNQMQRINNPNDLEHYLPLSSSEKIKEYFDNAAGKSGVGIFAISGTYYTLLQGKKVKLQLNDKDYDFKIKNSDGESVNLNKLSSATGVNRLNSAFLSVSVDNSKHKALYNLSQSEETMGVTALMCALYNPIATQYDEEYITKWLSQPILQEYLSKLSQASNQKERDAALTTTIVEYRGKYAEELEKEGVDTEEEGYEAPEYQGLSLDQLDENVYGAAMDSEYYFNQINILNQFIYLKAAADEIRVIQYAMNSFSKGTAPSILETIYKESIYNSIFENEDGEPAIKYFTKNLASISRDQLAIPSIQAQASKLSFLSPKLYSGNKETPPILPFGTAKFRKIFQNLLTYTGKTKDFSFSQDLTKRFFKAYQSFLWTNPKFDIHPEIQYLRNSLLKDFDGNASLGSEIEEFKKSREYLTNPRLKALFSAISVVPHKTSKDIKFVRFNAAQGLIVDDDDVRVALDVLYDTNKELFTRFFEYQLIMQGYSSPSNVRSYIPNYYFDAYGFLPTMQDINNNLNDTQEDFIYLNEHSPVPIFFEQFLQHNPEETKQIDLTDASFALPFTVIEENKEIGTDENKFYLKYREYLDNPYYYSEKGEYYPLPYLHTVNFGETTLFKLQGDGEKGYIYERITTLGVYGVDEYDASADKTIESIFPENNPKIKPKKAYLQFPMSSQNQELIKSGQKTHTTRNQPNLSGVYSLLNGISINVKKIGQIVYNSRQSAIEIYEGKNLINQLNLDDYAKKEGFENFEDLKSKIESNQTNTLTEDFLKGKQKPYLYAIEIISRPAESPQAVIDFFKQYGIRITDDKSLGYVLDLPSKIANITTLEELSSASSSFLTEMISYSDYFYNTLEEFKKSEFFESEVVKFRQSHASDKDSFNARRQVAKTLLRRLLENKFNDKLLGKTIVDKIKQFVSDFINLLKGIDYTIIDREVSKIVDSVFKGEDFIRLTKKEGFELLDFQKAIDSSPFAKDVITNLATVDGIILTGSLAFSTQGTVYRKTGTLIHDIDLVSLLTVEQNEELLLQHYPNSVKVYSFFDKWQVDTYIVPPKTLKITDIQRRDEGTKVVSYNIRNNKNKVVGTYKLNFEVSPSGKIINEVEIKTGKEAILVDFFTKNESERVAVKKDFIGSDGKPHVVNVADYKYPFEAKLRYSRFKDIWDYNRFIPNQITKSIISTDKEQEVIEQPIQNKEGIKPNEYTNHSGGAEGSDIQWDKIGKEFGFVNNKHYWTEIKTPHGNTEITKEDFEEGRYESAKAAKRNFGYQYSAMKDSRLIRNWSQVKHSDAIFAIGKIVDIGEKIFPNQKSDTRVAQTPSVTGGTGYAVGMGINHNKPVYIFNQSKSSKYDISWYKWDSNSNDFVKIETPALTKNFAGIGTREINDAGKQAIRDVYANTFKATAQPSTSVKEGILSIEDVLKEYTLDELKQGVNLRSLQDKVLKGDEETIRTAYNYLKANEKVELLKKEYDDTVEKNKEITRNINSLTQRINNTIPTKVGDTLNVYNDENASNYKVKVLEITRNKNHAILKVITAKKKEYTIRVESDGSTKSGQIDNFVFETSGENVDKLRAEKENLKSQLVSVKDNFDYNSAFSESWKDYFTPTQSTVRKTYSGKVTSLQPNQIFVFGSNPLGINGNPAKGTGGAALVAYNIAGVKQGEKMDNKLSDSGKAWGITTVTGPGKKRSKTPQEITEGIKKLYEFAKQNPTKEFLVSDYSATNLNGYSGQEMADMFNAAGPIPSNIVFNENFDKLVGITQPTVEPVGEVKEGVTEVFESNPELADAVYQILGFKTKTSENEITRGIKEVLPYKIIGDYSNIEEGLTGRRQYETKIGDDTYVFEISNYNYENEDGTYQSYYDIDFTVNGSEELVGTGFFDKSEKAKQIIQALISQNFGNDTIRFNVEESKKGKQRLLLYKRLMSQLGYNPSDEMEYALFYNANVAKVPSNKVISTTGYLSDLFESSRKINLTPQQKQQAQQIYSQYLEQNPNGSIEQFKNWVDEFNSLNKKDYSLIRNIELLKEGDFIQEGNSVAKIVNINKESDRFDFILIDDLSNVESNNYNWYKDFLKSGQHKIKKATNKNIEKFVKSEQILKAIYDKNKNVAKSSKGKRFLANFLGYNYNENKILTEYLNSTKKIDTLDVLSIIEKTDNEFKYIAKIIKDIIINNNYEIDITQNNEKEGVAGDYIDGKINMYIPTNDSQYTRVIIHELLHAISDNNAFQHKIDKLYNYVTKFLKDNNIDYGLKNNREFLAEIFSNKVFQELMAQFEYSEPNQNKKLSVLDKFLELLASFFKIENNSVLKEAFLILEDISKYNTLNTNNKNQNFLFSKKLNSLSNFISQKSQERINQIQEIFNQNPELSKIGTIKQYNLYLDTIFPDSKVKEMDSSLYISVLNQLEQENKIEKDCSDGGKLKAEKGLQANFTKGGKWRLIKDLKGYPTHKEGGVDLTIGKNGVSIKNGNTEFTAKHGLVIPKN